MTKVSKFLAVSVLLTVGFAGCVTAEEEASGQAAPAGAPPPSGPAQFDETSGAIHGFVTDDELVPIPGAQVGLLNTDIVVLAGENGEFALSNLEPTTYTVAAQALGFESDATIASVVVGQVTEVQFTLVPLPTDDPYSTILEWDATVSAIMYKATPTCIYEPLTTVNPLLKTCGGVRLSCSPGGACEYHYNDELDDVDYWTTIMGEATWEPQTGATGRGWLLDINAPNITRGSGGSINQASPYTFVEGTDDPPIRIRVDNPGTLLERGIPEHDWNNYPDGDCTAPAPAGTPHCEWFHRIFAAPCDLGFCYDGFGPDYGIQNDGRIRLLVSIFFREPAAADYSALPDG